MSGQAIPDEAPWVHVGSLSGGHGWAFMGPLSEERYRAEVEAFRQVSDACQRVGWWQRAWECAGDAIPDYHERYGVALARFRDDIGISQAEVEAYQRTCDQIVTWVER